MPNPISLNTETLRAVGVAVEKTFKSMADLSSLRLAHSIKPGYDAFGDISGVMHLMGNGTEGTIVLSFPKETIYYILARIYQQKFTELDGTVQDSVGEMINVVHGVFRQNLTKTIEGMRASPPHVVIGDAHRVVGMKNAQTMTVPFHVDNHQFQVSIQVRSVR